MNKSLVGLYIYHEKQNILRILICYFHERMIIENRNIAEKLQEHN